MKAIPACCRPGVLMVFLLSSAALFAQNQPQRSIAITIDDLPAGAAYSMTGADIVQMTTQLVGTLKDQKVPVVGFVNEQKLYKFGEVDDRIRALSLWLDAGFELGNHTFAHTSLNRAPLPAWEEEVIRGETVTRMLMAQHKLRLRYLRYPYLDSGLDIQTRRDAEAFLSSRGYQTAPVTMDAWDWMYAGVYDDARKRGDTALQHELVSSYVSYTATVFDFYEKMAKNMLGYEPKEILLMHANWLEAEHIGEILGLLRNRGYQFITVENALSDPVYAMPVSYVGEGTGWLDQVAITKGQVPQGEPQFPQWVIDKSRQLHPATSVAPAAPSPY